MWSRLLSSGEGSLCPSSDNWGDSELLCLLSELDEVSADETALSFWDKMSSGVCVVCNCFDWGESFVSTEPSDWPLLDREVSARACQSCGESDGLSSNFDVRVEWPDVLIGCEDSLCALWMLFTDSGLSVSFF